MSEEDRLVVIRFGRDWDPDCMRQDEVLYRLSFPILFLLLLRSPPLIFLSTLTNPTQANCVPLPRGNHRYRRPREKLRGTICMRPRSSTGLQADVRALRPGDTDVLLPQQAHDV